MLPRVTNKSSLPFPGNSLRYVGLTSPFSCLPLLSFVHHRLEPYLQFMVDHRVSETLEDICICEIPHPANARLPHCLLFKRESRGVLLLRSVGGGAGCVVA
jgi:hypothetical protein